MRRYRSRNSSTSVIAPSTLIASGIARLSLVGVAVFGFSLVIYLSFHGYDRAVLLIPTWFLLVVWVTTGGFAVAGWMTNDLVAPALGGGSSGAIRS